MAPPHVAVIAALLVATGAACPQSCRCRKDYTIYCNERKLREPPGGIPTRSRTLFLQQNEIEDMSSLGALPLLQRLVLNDNKLRSFPNDLPASLEHVAIARNQMKFVGRSALRSLVNLRELSLDANNITTAGFIADLSATRLVELVLSHNALDELPNNLPGTLKVLLVAHNRISVLPDLSHLTALVKLDVSGNRIGTLGTALAPLISLSTLDLSANHLAEVPYRLPTNLTELQLSGNRIRYIYRTRGLNGTGARHGDLQGLARLRRFDISHNMLESVEESAFDSLPVGVSRISIGLEHNPWRCDCNLRYLKRWLQANTQDIATSSNGNIRCTSPRQFSQVTIGGIDMSALACDGSDDDGEKSAFAIGDVTSGGFTLAYDAAKSREPPYVKMWLMYGRVSCVEGCEDEKGATSRMSEYKVVQVRGPRVEVRQLAPATRHLVCVFSANQDPNRIGVGQCESLTTLVESGPRTTAQPGRGDVIELVRTDDSDVTQQRAIPTWAVATLSCVTAAAFVVAMLALVAWRIRSGKKRHRKPASSYQTARMRVGVTGTNADANVAPFIMQRAVAHHLNNQQPLMRNGARQSPPLVDADHEFDVSLMTSSHRHKHASASAVAPNPANHNASYPSDSCCYSDSHADSIETTGTAASLRRHYDPNGFHHGHHLHHHLDPTNPTVAPAPYVGAFHGASAM